MLFWIALCLSVRIRVLVSGFRLVVLLLFPGLLCCLVETGVTLGFVIVIWFGRHIDLGFFWCYYL